MHIVAINMNSLFNFYPWTGIDDYQIENHVMGDKMIKELNKRIKSSIVKELMRSFCWFDPNDGISTIGQGYS